MLWFHLLLKTAGGKPKMYLLAGAQQSDGKGRNSNMQGDHSQKL